MLEHFIDYFEAHFIFFQKDANMPVLGQFRVMGEPDHFVWVRGFYDMKTRLESLQKFYDGPVWAPKNGNAGSRTQRNPHNRFPLPNLFCPSPLTRAVGRLVAKGYQTRKNKRYE
jgi:hypothetical protein